MCGEREKRKWHIWLYVTQLCICVIAVGCLVVWGNRDAMDAAAASDDGRMKISVSESLRLRESLFVQIKQQGKEISNLTGEEQSPGGEPNTSEGPTPSEEPNASGEPTPSEEPNASGEPTPSGEPTVSEEPTATTEPTQRPDNATEISYLISVEKGRKVDLSRYVSVKGGSSAARKKAKLNYVVLDVNNGNKIASIGKESGILIAKKTGRLYVRIQGETASGVFDTEILAVCIVKQSSSGARTTARRIDRAMGQLNVSKKLTKKNIGSYYNRFFSVRKAVDSFSQYSTYSRVNHDGENNYLGIVNVERYQAVQRRIRQFLEKKALSIKRISYISEYEGFVITWNHKIDTIDMVSYAFQTKKKYRKNRALSVGVTLSSEVKGGKSQKILVKLSRGDSKVLVKPTKSTLQTGMRILVIKSFCRTMTRDCRFAMIYKKSDKLVFPKRKVGVRSSSRNGNVIAYMDVYRSYRCAHTGSNGWYRVRLGGGKIGYVRKKDMAANQPKAFAAVSTSKRKYGYADMKEDIHILKNRYPGLLSVNVLAKTVDKNNIYCIRLGNENAPHKVVIQSTMHAREWMNVQFVMANIEHYCRNYQAASYKEVSYKKLFHNVCFYIVPLANPDGASISQYGLDGIKSKKVKKQVKKIGGNYKRWKANARGVDLNRNFSYGFGMKSGAEKPSYAYYAGKSAFSEKESRALRNLIEQVEPEVVLNYHQVGEVIYHHEDGELLEMVQKMTGYMPMQESDGSGDGSMGSWLTHKGIQWCTIETGTGIAPPRHGQFKTVWKQNKNIVAATAYLLLDDKYKPEAEND